MAILLLSVPTALQVVLYNGRAQIAVLEYLRPRTDVRSLGFLMPCHSTPWQAYLHRPTMADPSRFWSLGCEPPLS